MNSSDSLPRTALFHRLFDRYSGGHQKLLDYFEHVEAHPDWSPRIYWAVGSLPIVSTIWREKAARQIPSYDPTQADLLFLAGTDWLAYLPVQMDKAKPVINLIQHVRHSDPTSNVFPFLTERAIRICVSREVEKAILSTGRVNGPTFTIPNGIDQSALARVPNKDRDVFILGNKQRRLAEQLATNLEVRGLAVTAFTTWMPREEVLAAMSQSHVSVLLPNATEGFYLPALEAMALSSITVVPDCVGNRSFCADGENCLMPALELEALSSAVVQALSIARSDRCETFKRAAEATLARHTLARERSDFHAILDDIDAIW